MRKIISIQVEHPDCSTSNFREKLGKVISEELRTEVYDMWDGVDDRPQAAEPNLNINQSRSWPIQTN